MRLKNIAKACLPVAAVNALRPSYNRFRNSYFRSKGLHHGYFDHYDFFRKAFSALEFNGIKGDYVEFGCYGAGTFSLAHMILTKYLSDSGQVHQWAFDSFEGLPESVAPADAHPQWIKGELCMSLEAFHKRCKQRGIPRSAYTAVPGFYDVSLAPDAAGHRPTTIRLAYIDCDMYSSTKTVLEFLKPRLQHGMIIAFDDYYSYSSDKPSGERLAAAQVFGDSNTEWRMLPYVQYGWHGMSFVVEAVGAYSGNLNAHW